MFGLTRGGAAPCSECCRKLSEVSELREQGLLSGGITYYSNCTAPLQALQTHETLH